MVCENKKKISKTPLLLFLNFICVFASIIVYYSNNVNTFQLVTVLSLFEIVFTVLLITNKNGSVFSIGLIFILLTYLFNFGQFILGSFNINNFLIHDSVVVREGVKKCLDVEIFLMICILFFSVGYALCSRNKYQKTLYDFDKSSLNNIYRMFLILFIITFIPMVYSDFVKIIAYISHGYLATYDTYASGVTKYISFIGQFCKPTLGILIFSSIYHPKRAKIWMISSILYLVVIMLSGDRGSSVIYIVSFLFIYYRFVKKLKLKTIIIGAVVGYFFLIVLSVISILREHSFSIENVIAAYSERKTDGIIYTVLREFGGSVITLMYSIDSFPSFSNFNYGGTYLASLISILPDVPDFINDALTNSFTFVRAFPTNLYGYESLGGNYIGELFYNFGYFSPIFMIIIGMVISKMDKKINYSHDIPYIIFILILLPSLFLWVRDYFSVMVFKTFWLFIYFKLFCYSRKKEKIYRNNLVQIID